MVLGEVGHFRRFPRPLVVGVEEGLEEEERACHRPRQQAEAGVVQGGEGRPCYHPQQKVGAAEEEDPEGKGRPCCHPRPQVGEEGVVPGEEGRPC